jgi:two-component system, NarL family, response regulator FusR
MNDEHVDTDRDGGTPLPVKRRVFLVDDHPIVRDGLTQMLEGTPDLCVCGAAGGAEEALAALAEPLPDLVVVDIFLERSNGIDLTKTLRDRFPALPILVLSMHDEQVYAERAIRAGANGYVMKQVASRQILDAMRTVLDGKRFLNPTIEALLAEPAPDRVAGPPDEGLDRLSGRELTILEMMGRGEGKVEIGAKLSISSKTVETHYANMKNKLRLKNVAELQRRAARWIAAADNQGAD